MLGEHTTPALHGLSRSRAYRFRQNFSGFGEKAVHSGWHGNQEHLGTTCSQPPQPGFGVKHGVLNIEADL